MKIEGTLTPAGFRETDSKSKGKDVKSAVAGDAVVITRRNAETQSVSDEPSLAAIKNFFASAPDFTAKLHAALSPERVAALTA